MTGFYVYAYLDPRNEGLFEYGGLRFHHEPFYIGKGCDGRCFYFEGHRGFFTQNKMKAIRSSVLSCVRFQKEQSQTIRDGSVRQSDVDRNEITQ